MREVYFKSILIADIQKNVAHLQRFEKGFNVVTSVDNHVGKSSLLKSLYYTLGAEVEFDSAWNKNTKLFVVTISIDDSEYQVCRFMKRFAVFHGKELILITDSVTKELAPLLGELFDFSVYLPNKDTEKVELAPPAFTFMPYYIDQDKGWSGLYDSFAQITQYKKQDRTKSLYYHLSIYTRKTVELLAQKDNLKDKLDSLQEESNRLSTILAALREETNNLPPADTIQELEMHLEIPKRRISELISQSGEIRNLIQELESSLFQHKYKLKIIQEYSAISRKEATPVDHTPRACPNCGYIFDNEIFEIVRSNYSALNEDYMCQQIHLIIESVTQKLSQAKAQYISLMNQLTEEETAFKSEQNEFEIYVRQRGLRDSVRRFSEELGRVTGEIAIVNTEIKQIKKELSKLPNKKDIEEKYIEFVRLNIMTLDAWDPTYDGNIQLLQPIKAQGTLENKIILAQFVGLFQTMAYFQSNATRFPFVVDSPRAKEASASSSKDILTMIAQLDMLPQVILATIDYAEYQSEIETPTTIITLAEKRKLLSDRDYAENEQYILTLIELLKNA